MKNFSLNYRLEAKKRKPISRLRRFWVRTVIALALALTPLLVLIDRTILRSNLDQTFWQVCSKYWVHLSIIATHN